ncbi:hypothetical protein [Microbacterium lacticum]
MTVIPTADIISRLAAVPSPTEWDVSFTRLSAMTWDVTIYLAAERDPHTSAPDAILAAGTIDAETVGDEHRYNIRGSETLTWFGGDPSMLDLAHQIVAELSFQADQALPETASTEPPA